MAYYNTSSAYDFGVFERPVHTAAEEAPVRQAAQPKRRAQVIQLEERQLRRSHRRNANAFKTVVGLVAVMVLLSAIGAVVFSQVQLTELTAKINAADKLLTEQKSISVQLEMQAASRMNTDEIAVYARERLGMEKVTEGQTTYINLAQDDTGVVHQENEQPSALKELWNTIRSAFS